MQPVHSNLLNAAARKILRPLGVRQKGRSRLWYDDHGWWLIVIEFQPSSWSQGSYLNVGAMWLWYEKDYFSFDFGNRVANFQQFQSETQFAPVADGLAIRAADEVKRLRLQFETVDAVADCLLAQSQENIWDNFNTAVACGLAGRSRASNQYFEMVAGTTLDVAWAQAAAKVAQSYIALTANPIEFRHCIKTVVGRARQALKLDSITEIEFNKGV